MLGKVLVLGGAGYIGSHVVLELIERGYEVVVFDNLSTGHKQLVPSQVKFYKGDITNSSDLEKVFSKENIDVVMNFAAKIVVPESVTDPLGYYYNNFEGTRLVLSKMVEHQVKNIIFSSTAAVYGEPTEGICHESTYLNPINPYGSSKLASERLIQDSSHAYGINYIIFRYFNVAGSDSQLRSGLITNKPTHIVPIITESMLEIRGPITIFGNDYPTKDGTNIRDYVHVSDIASAHVKGVKYLLDGNDSTILNLGSNQGYSVLDVAKEANKIGVLKYSFGPRRAGDPAILIASNSKVKKILNWEPKFSLYDMIESDIKFRKKTTQLQ